MVICSRSATSLSPVVLPAGRGRLRERVHTQLDVCVHFVEARNMPNGALEGGAFLSEAFRRLDPAPGLLVCCEPHVGSDGVYGAFNTLGVAGMLTVRSAALAFGYAWGTNDRSPLRVTNGRSLSLSTSASLGRRIPCAWTAGTSACAPDAGLA